MWARYSSKANMAILRALTSRLPLRDSGHIPVLGLGVYLAEADGETEQACLWALKHGYRHIDTAQFYRYCLAAVFVVDPLLPRVSPRLQEREGCRECNSKIWNSKGGDFCDNKSSTANTG